ncbi:hypothetical protein F53441_12367 [Fusarium austroafricanum]|uniref:Uncharacterized protein n=1 Tax=Fusarium austroafricanum TaxID=2364996 RepID=A0A8H4JXS4_9HYPO|nr:hypothetical protein F53441_12367 [Fusarium austroafricanum]
MYVFGGHPIDAEHEELCSGALEKAQEFYQQWNPDFLMFDPTTIAKYQHADFGTQAFNVRLLELVAASLHEIGVLLFQLGFRMHKGNIEAVTDWRIPDLGPDLVDVPPRPTLFGHHAYLDADIYPNGIADIVGYWAEDRILGGVTVFDRRTEVSLPGIQIPNVYFHSCRRLQTHRVYQLRHDQQEALLMFLLAETDSPLPEPNPLPILSDAENRVCVNSEFAIIHYGIY